MRYGDHILASKVSAWKMPAFRYTLNEAETWTVIDYIKSFWSEDIRQKQIDATVRLKRLEELTTW